MTKYGNINDVIYIYRTERLPVLYIFGQESVDVKDCIDKFVMSFADSTVPIIIIYDVIFHHIIG